jgi:hypothetical protein
MHSAAYYITLCRKKQAERSIFYAAADLPENFRSMEAGTARPQQKQLHFPPFCGIINMYVSE